MIFLVDPPSPRTVEGIRNGIDPCNISKHGIIKRELVINFPSTVIERSASNWKVCCRTASCLGQAVDWWHAWLFWGDAAGQCHTWLIASFRR